MKENFDAETLRGLYRDLGDKAKTKFLNYCVEVYKFKRNTLQHKFIGSTEFRYNELVLLIPAIKNEKAWL